MVDKKSWFFSGPNGIFFYICAPALKISTELKIFLLLSGKGLTQIGTTWIRR